MPTTVNSSIGKIIGPDGSVHGDAAYELPPRGIAWVVSSERINMPNTATGISTLRTSWTRRGILTLTVGVVDPGYHGNLSTAVVNFSSQPFQLQPGDEFLRTVFFEHDDFGSINRTETEESYLKGVISDTSSFSETFLTVDTLALEIRERLFGLPSWAIKVGLVGLTLAVLALTLTPVLDIALRNYGQSQAIDLLEYRVKELEQANFYTPSKENRGFETLSRTDEAVVVLSEGVEPDK